MAAKPRVLLLVVVLAVVELLRPLEAAEVPRWGKSFLIIAAVFWLWNREQIGAASTGCTAAIAEKKTAKYAPLLKIPLTTDDLVRT
jgi:hypothetical protein